MINPFDLLIRFVIFSLIGGKIIRGSYRCWFRYQDFVSLDIRIAYVVAALTWAWLLFIYGLVLLDHFTIINAFVNFQNYSVYLRPTSLFLLGSTGYIITRLLP